MISANELRIGNWIQDLANTYIQIQAKGIELLSMDSSGFKPIRLSKSWLLKFGFEQQETYHIYRIKTQIGYIYNINLTYNKFSLEVDETDELTSFTIIRHDLNYVHQLQNLYFALIGEEL